MLHTYFMYTHTAYILYIIKPVHLQIELYINVDT